MSTDINWTFMKHKNISRGIVSMTQHNGRYIVVEYTIHQMKPAHRTIGIECGCPCQNKTFPVFFSAVVNIPLECNSIVVMCKLCKRGLFRVSGFVSGEWTLEIPN